MLLEEISIIPRLIDSSTMLPKPLRSLLLTQGCTQLSRGVLMSHRPGQLIMLPIFMPSAMSVQETLASTHDAR